MGRQAAEQTSLLLFPDTTSLAHTHTDTHKHKNASFSFLQIPYGTYMDSVAACIASLFLKWTQRQTQCYGNDHIAEQCRVPDPEVQEAVNQFVTAEV